MSDSQQQQSIRIEETETEDAVAVAAAIGGAEPNPSKKFKRKKKKTKNRTKERTKEETTTTADVAKHPPIPETKHDCDEGGEKGGDCGDDQQSNDKHTQEIQQQYQRGAHPFEADDSDHCETPLKAYQDLEVVLDRLLAGVLPDGQQQKQRRKQQPRSSLRIYDPYYCDGGVKTKLASMGFTNVTNRNRDFYKDIESGALPEYDVMVTNPPYSGRHMERLLEFCASPLGQQKPSFLLLPHFVYTKDYYQRALSGAVPNHSSSLSSFFYFLVPGARYSYLPPAWVTERSGASKALARGKETTAPFPSFWYCHVPTTTTTTTTTTTPRSWLESTFGPSGSVRSFHLPSGLRYAGVPGDIPRAFKGEFDATNKRPNPRARKRMRKAAAAAAGGMPQQSPQRQQRQTQRKRQRDKKKKRRY